jgi:hypothetical protein
MMGSSQTLGSMEITVETQMESRARGATPLMHQSDGTFASCQHVEKLSSHTFLARQYHDKGHQGLQATGSTAV